MSKPRAEVALSPSPVVPLTLATSETPFSFSQFVANFNAEREEETSIDETIPKKEDLNPFDEGLSAFESSTPREEPTTKIGITKFEARFKSTKQPGDEEMTTPTENPFAAAINALKTSIFQTEVTESTLGGLTNEIMSSKERHQNEITPFGFPTTLSFSTIEGHTTERSVKDSRLQTTEDPANEILLNAFEEIFETLTSESPLEEPSTQAAFELTESSFLSPTTEQTFRFESFTTEGEKKENIYSTQASIQSDIISVNEAENMIPGDEIYNIFESTDSVSPGNVNDLQNVPGLSFDFNTKLPEDMRSQSIESIILTSTESQDVALETATEKDTRPILVVSTDLPAASMEVSEVDSRLGGVIRPEEVEISTTEPSLPVDISSTETVMRLDDLFDNSITGREGKSKDFNGAVEGNLELTGPNKNLATKIMSNGVRVIVAGKNSLHRVLDNGIIIRNYSS